MPPAPPPEVTALGTGARRRRVAAAVTALVLLVLGTVRGSDDAWPFAPMSQFAFAVDLDGEVRSSYVEAVTTAGDRVAVPLSPDGVGLRRAEVEGQVGRFERDPRLLETIAAAHAVRHPDAARYARVELRQRVGRLADGVVVSSADALVTAWTVPDPQRPWGCCADGASR